MFGRHSSEDVSGPLMAPRSKINSLKLSMLTCVFGITHIDKDEHVKHKKGHQPPKRYINAPNVLNILKEVVNYIDPAFAGINKCLRSFKKK